MNELTKKAYETWKNAELSDEALRKELASIANDEEAINDRFYKELAFGTGGLRGVLGVGSNRMNIYTVGKASRGLANYIIPYQRLLSLPYHMTAETIQMYLQKERQVYLQERESRYISGKSLCLHLHFLLR